MPNDRRQPLKFSLLTAALLTLTSGAMAAGLGRLTVMSAIGEPLAAEIELSASPDEMSSLAAKMASPDDFQKQGIEYHPSLSSVRVMLDKRADGRPFLRLYSDRPFNEPFFDVLIELSWASGRVKREYTALLDPPAAMRRPPVVETPAIAPSMTPPKVVAAPAQQPAVRPIEPAEPALAASEKPARPAAQEAEETGGRTVKRGDTLTGIAREVKPDGVTLDQILVALFRSNREAFVDNNMNRLKAGRILRLPQAEEAYTVDPAEARRIIIAQASDFNAYRQKLASTVASEPSRAEAARQEVSGRITPKVEEKLPLPAGKDKLEVSRAEQARDVEAGKRIAALEEDLVSRDKALKEANERIAQLEKNLLDLKKLLELKSQPGAQMQAQAEAVKPPVKPEEKPLKAADSLPIPPADMPKVAEPVKPVEPEKPVAEVSPTETAKPVAEAPAPAEPEPAKPAPAKPTPPKPVEAPPPQPGFLEENLLLVAIGGGLIAGLLGFLGFRTWKRRKEMAEPTREMSGMMTTGGDLSSTGGHSVDTGGPSIQTDFGPGGAAGIDADEGVDPVAEADVYMAYGRDAQAEEILLEALKSDPARQAIHMKLLEIYSMRQSARQFETVARDLHGLTGGAGDDWAKAVAMGKALEPGNPLYGGAGGSTAVLDSTVIVAPDTAAKLAETVVSSGELAKVAEAAEFAPQTPAVSEAPEAPEVVSIEFDLDSPSPETTAVAKPAEEVMSLDFDLDIGAPAASAETSSAPQAAEEVSSLDLDLGLEAPPSVESWTTPVSPAPAMAAAVSESSPEVATEPASGGALDFELELPSLGETAATEEQVVPVVTSPPLDLSGISLDLEVPPIESPSIAAASTIDEPRPVDGDNPEIAIKLELAQAYEEMGDKEGARELLEEVLRDGSPNQKQIARARMSKLDA